MSGQGPFDPASGAVVGDSIEPQARQCFTNISAILAAAGSSLDDVVSATFILRDAEDFDGLNAEWARWFLSDPPARMGTKMGISLPEMRISISVVARLPLRRHRLGGDGLGRMAEGEGFEPPVACATAVFKSA